MMMEHARLKLSRNREVKGKNVDLELFSYEENG